MLWRKAPTLIGKLIARSQSAKSISNLDASINMRQPPQLATLNTIPHYQSLSNILFLVQQENKFSQDSQLHTHIDNYFEEIKLKSKEEQINLFLFFITTLKLTFSKSQQVHRYTAIKQKIAAIVEDMPVLQQYFSQLKVNVGEYTFAKKVQIFPSLEFVPRGDRKQIIMELLPSVSSMNPDIMLAFTNDAILNNYEIPYEFFERFEDISFHTYLRNNEHLYYNLLKFTQHYRQAYFFTRGIATLPDCNANETFENPSHHTILSLFTSHPTNLTEKFYFIKKLFKKGRVNAFSLKKTKASTFLKNLNSIHEIYPLGTDLERIFSLFYNEYIVASEASLYGKVIDNLISSAKPSYRYSLSEAEYRFCHSKSLLIVLDLISKLMYTSPEIILKLNDINFLHYESIPEKIIETFEQLLEKSNLSLTQNKKKTFQLIKFCATYLQTHKKRPIENLLSQLSKIPSFTGTSQDQKYCQFVLNLLTILGPQKQFDEFYWRVCSPYIHRHCSRNESTLHEPKPLEIKILRLFYELNISDDAEKKTLSKFLNNQFIYTVKSVIREDILIILKLIERLPNVNIEIVEYLFENFSTFINFRENENEYFLFQSKNKAYERIYYDVIKYALKNKDLLKNIQRKEKLSILQFFTEIFWDEISNRQFIVLLEILESPSNLSEDLKKLFRKRKFEAHDLQYCNLSVIRSFQFYNIDFRRLLNEDENINKFIQDISYLNSCSPAEMEQIFKVLQFYEFCLESKTFRKEQNIPFPLTHNKKIKMIYTCLKIYEKIKNYKNFSLEEKEPSKNIDINDQIQYIKENQLVEMHSLNEFKLDNVRHPHHPIIAKWYSFNYTSLIAPIKMSNFFVSSYDENYYESVLLMFFGNPQEIRNICSKETCDKKFIQVAEKLKLEVYNEGSLIQIKHNQRSIYFISSKPQKSKLHRILAFALERNKLPVRILNQNVEEEEFRSFLLEKFEIDEELAEDNEDEEQISPQLEKQQGQR